MTCWDAVATPLRETIPPATVHFAPEASVRLVAGGIVEAPEDELLLEDDELLDAEDPPEELLLDDSGVPVTYHCAPLMVSVP